MSLRIKLFLLIGSLNWLYGKNSRILTCCARENMVSGDEPESMVQDVVQQPQLGSSALRDDNATSNPCIYLANRDFFTNVSLIHPESLSVPSHFRYNNNHINGQFCAAALSNLPESTDITHVSFNDMNLGLLFALFGKYEGKGNHKANAAKII